MARYHPQWFIAHAWNNLPTGRKKAIYTAQKLFDKPAEMVFLSAGNENENHVCTNAKARVSQRTDVHLGAC
jgi:hypothetical protein